MKRRVRVALDVHMVGSRQTGNETYARALASALARHSDDVDLLLYATRQAEGLLPEAPTTWLPELPDALRIAAVYPWLAARHRADVLHVTYVAPPLLRTRTVVSVHDVTFKLFPEHFSPRDLAVLNRLVGISARRAGAVLTLSQSAKEDIVAHLGVAEEKVWVTPLAAEPEFSPAAAAQSAAVAHKFGLNRRYILAVGDLQPRKNLPRFVHAFARIAAEVDDVDLVLAGKVAWRGSDVERAVREHGLESRVRLLGYVDARDLPGLYAGAVCLGYPSLYEGFGLPIVEAMACGTPVVAGNRSSLPEVVGSGGITVDPESTSGIAAALIRLLNERGLRQKLSHNALRHARGFTWERTATETIAAYNSVVAWVDGKC